MIAAWKRCNEANGRRADRFGDGFSRSRAIGDSLISNPESDSRQFEGCRVAGAHLAGTTIGRRLTVAQVSNLRYRRFPIGWRCKVVRLAGWKSSIQQTSESISIAERRRRARGFWTTVAERSGATAFVRWGSAPKAAWRFASCRSPKVLVAALRRRAVSRVSKPACRPRSQVLPIGIR